MTQQISLNGSDWLMKPFVGEDWLLRIAHKPETRDTRNWRPAVVPGSVQHDAWQAGLIPDPYTGLNSLSAEWTSDRTWVYKKTFLAPAGLQGQRVNLVFEGVDYSARYYLNGEDLGRSEGMFLPARFEVSQQLRYGQENLLSVVIDPAPFEQPQIGYTSRVYTQKARMNYWWDFCPRIVHQGIWQDVYLEVSGPVRIADLWTRCELDESNQKAVVSITVELDRPAGTDTLFEIDVQLEDGSPQGHVTVPAPIDQDSFQVQFELPRPRLWWPNGAGDQPLYLASVRALSRGELSDRREVTFGVRRVAFIANQNAAKDALPYTLVVNGRRMYIKGWNWVPMDVLYGVPRPEKRARLLRLAKNAHVNLLRVWGGGLIEQEAFYEQCDRLGILVWQEFIQSSSGIDNYPSSDPAFLAFLTRNAEQAIRARRNHPSLAVWCGGNELHYSGDHLCDEQHPALAALRDAVQRLDAGRHWVPSSPSGGLFPFKVPESADEAARMHDVHGPWEYQGLRGQYQLYNQGESLLHSEFGVEGLTNRRALDVVIPREQQWPVLLTNPIWDHLGAWWVKDRVWNEVFGPLNSVDEIRRATQFMQADGLRYALEADRRRKYHNSGAMPWQFNEPYPMASCTSAVDYFAEPKPLYYAAARAYRPLTVTARFDSLAWGGEETFAAQIWASNSSTPQAARLVARVVAPDGHTLAETNQATHLPPDSAFRLADISMPIRNVQVSFFLLHLALLNEVGELLAENGYLFSAGENLAPLLSAPGARVEASFQKEPEVWLVTVRNPSGQSALWAWLEAGKADLSAPGYAYFDDNYFCLLPGEQRSVRVEWSGVPEHQRELTLSGWNFPEIRLA